MAGPGSSAVVVAGVSVVPEGSVVVVDVASDPAEDNAGVVAVAVVVVVVEVVVSGPDRTAGSLSRVDL